MIDEDRNLKHVLRTYISSALNCKDLGLMAQTMTCTLLLRQFKILPKEHQTGVKIHKPKICRSEIVPGEEGARRS